MQSKGGVSLFCCRVLIFLAIFLSTVFLIRGCIKKRAISSKESLRRVQVIKHDIKITKSATGEATPQNRVAVKPPIAGRIEEVIVREGEAVKKGDVLAWMSSAERAALLDAARSEGDEALFRWESVYKPAPLIAPLDGTVIVRAVEAGQTVTTGDSVVVIADRLIVKAQVDETDIGSVKVGQLATINLDAFPAETIQAHVDHVAYEAKTVNNVTIYEVDVLPDFVPDFMRSGMTAIVYFTISEKPAVIVLPVEAVSKDDSGGSTVMVPGSKGWGVPKTQKITTGLADGKWVEIISGLQEGDTVLSPSLSLPPSKSSGSNPFLPFGGGRRPSEKSRSSNSR